MRSGRRPRGVSWAVASSRAFANDPMPAAIIAAQADHMPNNPVPRPGIRSLIKNASKAIVRSSRDTKPATRIARSEK